MCGHKPFCRALRGAASGTVSPLHLPSTVFKESWDGQDSTVESDSMPPIVPGCRHISEHTRNIIGKHTEEETRVRYNRHNRNTSLNISLWDVKNDELLSIK